MTLIAGQGTASADSQDLPLSNSQGLVFQADVTQFNWNASTGTRYCDIDLMIYTSRLKLHRSGNGSSADLQVLLHLADESGDPVLEKVWETHATVDTSQLLGQVIFDRHGQWIASGSYSVTVTVRDLNGGEEGRATGNLTIPEPLMPGMHASQIRYVSRLVPSEDQDNLFYQNGRLVYPNPGRIYGLLYPVLRFSYEIYDIPDQQIELLEVTYTLRMVSGEVVQQLPVQSLRVPGNSAAVLHGIDVSTLQTGRYVLSIAVSDQAAEEKIQLLREFEILQADALIAGERPDAGQIEMAGHVLEYLATPAELKLFQSLDVNGKARFLIDFWAERDPDPSTPVNEDLQQVQSRYHYANRHFGWAEQSGWKSDRGRVLISYGMPDEVEHYPSEADTVPYIIWIYRTDRSYEFVFADLRTNGQYVLLHSTVEDEIHNENWQQMVQRM